MANADEKILLAAVDVDYRADVAVAAGIWFRGWFADEVELEETLTIRNVAPYQPGKFFRRELPCLLSVLNRGLVPKIILVDGYVWLEDKKPGLGHHLYEALNGASAIVGVAKTRYASAAAVEVYRGKSLSPLYVTSVGVDIAEAARCVGRMQGESRVPAMLKRVDQLARRTPWAGKT